MTSKPTGFIGRQKRRIVRLDKNIEAFLAQILQLKQITMTTEPQQEHDANHTESNNHGDAKTMESDNSGKKAPVTTALINQMLPKELILKIFSNLDTISLCRCAQVSKYWNELALDGANWQEVSLFNFRGIDGRVVENLSRKCGNFLKVLTLRNCRSVSDSSMQVFAQNCRNLEEINIDDCRQITDSTCISLALNCHRLSHLNIASCDISDEALAAVGKGCKGLRHINISGCKKVTAAGVEKLAKNCGELLSFISTSFDANTINDQSIKVLATHCRKLKMINLNRCSAITDEAIIRLSENCHDIIYCCLSECINITDQALIALSQGCPNLKSLGLVSCNHLTDSGFQTLAKSCKHLENLDLQSCSLITDQTLFNLANGCPNLKRLVLSHCEHITDDGIKHLTSSQGCADNIQYLELDNCPQLTDSTIDHLIFCRKLERLELFDNLLITKEAIKRLYVLPMLCYSVNVNTFINRLDSLELDIIEGIKEGLEIFSVSTVLTQVIV